MCQSREQFKIFSFMYIQSILDQLPPICWSKVKSCSGLGFVHCQPSTCSRTALSSQDRKSTRLNSSHQIISYAVFCLKKKKGCLGNVRLYHVVMREGC